ncbi:V-type ATP synthase subunit D [Candidatus Woesearchaeota archaeon]|nr:V-type ATP synthase subunit D [Candidatus Woesearchaeota archaeon]
MADVKPTRSELLLVKKKITLAVSGHKLLRKKRDGLILEFFSILKKARNIRAALIEEHRSALGKINIARAIDSDIQIKSAAMSIKRQPLVELETKNIMGVKIPSIKSGEVKKSIFERGYGLLSATSKIDEAAEAYESLVEKIIAAAEIDITLKRLLKEIERTKRKVNALEQITIPRLNRDAAYIRFRLEEMERDNFSRLKMLKTAR